MCDHAAFSAMDERVDALDKRLIAVESKQDSLQQQMATGFADLKSYIATVMAEAQKSRAEWSVFARKWIGRGIALTFLIVSVACGVNQYAKARQAAQCIPQTAESQISR